MVHKWGEYDVFSPLWPEQGLAVFHERRECLMASCFTVERADSVLRLESRTGLVHALVAVLGEAQVAARRGHEIFKIGVLFSRKERAT